MQPTITRTSKFKMRLRIKGMIFLLLTGTAISAFLASTDGDAAAANRAPVEAQNQTEAVGTWYSTAGALVGETRPGPAEAPIGVSVGLYVNDIVEIDDAERTFTVDLFGRLRWKDSRLAPKGQSSATGTRQLLLEDIWHPWPAILNRREFMRTFPDTVEVNSEGMVTYKQRLYGNLSNPLDLKDFPFDRHILKIEIVSLYQTDEVLFTVDEEIIGQTETPSIVDWTIGPGSASVDSKYIPSLDRSVPRFVYEFEVRRRLAYYIWKVLIPLSLIVLISWAVFWIDPSQLGPQMGISITAVLTLMVYLHRMGDLLPRVPYLTRIDELIFGSLVLVFLAFFEAIATGTLAGRGKTALAQRFDRWSRWIFPAVFAVLVAFVFLR